MIGDSIGPFYFNVNSTTGAITLRNNLRTDKTNFNYVLRVTAYDTAYPTQVATATVEVSIARNEFSPQFTQSPYRVTINETTSVGTSILSVLADDADGDRVVYTATGDNDTLTFFYLSTDTGLISVRQPLSLDSRTEYLMSIVASDQGNPARTTPVLAIITVIRDESAPFFINQPYSTVVNELVTVGTSVYAVTATDSDLVGQIIYELIGDYPTQSFFGINSQTGLISTTFALKSDNLRAGLYIARVVAYDSLRPQVRATATVDISVIRNPNGPEWQAANYFESIAENTPVGSTIFNVTAIDLDVDDFVTYEITSQTALPFSPLTPYFYIDRVSGIITLRQPLSTVNITQFTLLLKACDQGIPQRCADITARVAVVRNQFFPLFVNLPYQIVVREDREPSGVSLLTLTAQDRDIIGSIVYEQTLPGVAYFNVNPSSGDITLQSSLRLDSRIQIVFQVVAYDSLDPDRRTTADVTVLVTRNPSGPSFLSDPYEVTIGEGFPLGDIVINTTAIDSDGDVLRYYLNLDDATDPGFFYVNPDNGVITLRRLLQDTDKIRFILSVGASDQRIPEKAAVVSVFVTVIRDNQDPFFLLPSYNASIVETVPVGASVTTVSASDNDLVGLILYQTIGVYPANEFFDVNAITGGVSVIKSLLTDPLQATSYTLRLVAYDNAYAANRATSDVTIIVLRNVNGPIFVPSATYETTVNENIDIGARVISVSAQDRDAGDIVTYELVNPTSNGTQYFFLDRDTGEISSRKALTSAPLNLYTLTVNAKDNRGRGALASVRIFIQRITDEPPVFLNTPYRTTIDVNQAVNSTIYQVTARDLDAQSPIQYALVGYFPGSSYFELNPLSGQITLKQSIINDQFASLLYVLRIEAFEVLRQDLRVAEDVLIDVTRNPSPPVFSQNFYVQTVSESEAQGTSVLQVSASEGDGDVVTYEIDAASQNGITAQDFFFINPGSGTIFIRKNLALSSQSQYLFTVVARDDGYPQKTDQASVQINIIRDQFSPSFSRSNYIVTIVETTAINDTIQTVVASDDDLQDTIVYEAIGDGPALAFFSIDAFSGVVRVRNNLRESAQELYILSIRAYDSFYPNNLAAATVTINVIRNPNAPVFELPSYSETVRESLAAGSLILPLTARDLDGDAIGYTLLNVGSCLEYFYVSPDTGAFSLRKPLFQNSVNQYACIVQASDQRTRVTNATVTITVLRSQPPRFVNTPYSFSVGERTLVGSSVYTVLAVDTDLEGQIVYEVVGDAPAPSYFSVDSNTGVIAPRTGLTIDTTQSYRLVVTAYDTAFPQQQATAEVNIFVVRNENPPFFINEQLYSVDISEDFAIGDFVIAVTALDNDNDTIRYSLLGDETAIDFFYLNPASGDIFLTRRLDLTTATSFTLAIRASDQRVPERVDETTVIIRVARNQFAPVFFNTPYATTVQESRARGSTVFALECSDQDLRGQVMYESIGLYPAQSFFTVNMTTGLVTIAQSLREDGFARTEYTLRVVCYDSVVPSQRTPVDLTIAIIRNINSPVFSQSQYSVVIPEDFAQNRPVLSLSASDLDNDTIAYTITRDNSGGNSLSYFFIERNSGTVFLRQPLLGKGISQFSFTVTATDSGRPSRSTEVSCIVNVQRDQFPPQFINTPYQLTITELSANNSIVYTVTAVDQDLQGQVEYVVVGVPPAPTFFTVNSNGGVVVRGDLRTDRAMDYTLRVQAFDSASPSRFDEADVRISIRRNVNAPLFSQQTYTTSITERTTIGTSIVSVIAIDRDGDTLLYSLVGDDRCREVFYLGPDNGILYLKEPLLDAVESAFTCTLSVTDQGYPVPQTDSCTVVVNIERDTFLPVFTENARYTAQIPENTAIGSSLQRVSASRVNIIGRIYYESVGDYPAPSFFKVDNLTGEVTTTADLRNDNLGLTSYILRVRAYDTLASYLQSEAEVFITVIRNLNRPVFNPARYFVTIREDEAVGTFLQKLTVTDPDGDKVTCSITGTTLAQQFFDIDSDACLVRIRTALTEDNSRNTEYTVSVFATDNQQTASAEVFVTVLRDLFQPQFTNLPTTISVDETININSTVFTASATDADLQGSIRYEVIGLFPSQSFFNVDPVSGAVVLRNSLMSDAEGRISYTLRIQAYDTVYSGNRVQADLVIRVVRNRNGPVFANGRYDFTIAETFPLGNIIGTVEATDADRDQVTFTSLAGGEAADLFFLNSETGTISLRSPLIAALQNQYAFEVEASDNRASSIIKRSRVTVTISILRDSGPPRFVNTPYEINVPINQAVNSSVFQVVATDPDLKGEIKYRLDGYQPGTLYFGLDTDTGSITVRRILTLDTDVFASYTLLVTAFDTGNPEIETTEAVKINVIRNLFSPRFVSSTYEDSVFDYQPVGTNVLQVAASDDDITSPENEFVFSIEDGNAANNFFSINPFSGIITVNRDLSESTPSTYTFRVIARDLGASSRNSFTRVTINILRNEGRPQFVDSNLYDVVVSETISVLDTIIQVSAVDPDPATSQNGQIRYSIVGPVEAKAFFQIEPVSGVITARVSLTTAPDDFYRLTVRASDLGVIPQTVDAIASIRIRREGFPFFPENEYLETRSESTPVASTIIQLQATDPLNKELRYEITGDGLASTLFSIDQRTGLITLAQSLESDKNNTYIIRVSAYRVEDATIRAQTIVRVQVTRNANPPTFLHGNLEYTISEDQPLGVSIGQVNATDADSGANGEFTFSISTVDSSPSYANTYFFMNPVTGVLAVSSSLRDDVDRPLQYLLSVVVTDNGFPRRSSVIRVTIIVVRNRFGPEFRLDSYEVNIDENIPAGTSIVTVQAVEQEGDAVVYSLLGTVPASLYFVINPTTGVIRTNATIVFDTTTKYSLTVQAVDIPRQAASPRTALAGVVINVSRNPNAPVFEQNEYLLTISEYASVQSSIANVRATDNDPPDTPSGTIVYSIIATTYNRSELNGEELPNIYDFFIISPTAGIVLVAQTLAQARVPSRFVLTIQAADNARPPKVALATMTIDIVRNIHRPEFTEFTYGAAVENTWAVGRVLLTLTARDDDIDVPLNRETPNAEFEYVVDPDFEQAEKYFGVTQNGVLFVKSSLLNAPRLQYFFYIIAIDESWSPLSSRAPVTINVTQLDVDRRDVGFIERVITWSLPENSVVANTQPLLLEIANADSDVQCRIIAINDILVTDPTPFAVRSTVDKRHCELYLTATLDRELRGTYNITIQASQATSRKKRQISNVSNTWSTTSILLTVQDVNDEVPVWGYPTYPSGVSGAYVFAIGDRSSPGTSAGKLEATDLDLGAAGTVSYSISTGSPFVLTTGQELVLSRSLATEQQGTFFYSLTATARDGATPFNSRTTQVIINLISDPNRFVLVINNRKPQDIVPIVETIRRELQVITDAIVIIETVRTKLQLDGASLNFDSDGTDIYFVVARKDTFRLFPNTDLDLVTESGNSASQLKANALSAQLNGASLVIRPPYDLALVTSASEEVRSALNIGAELRTKTKSYTWWTDDPWVAFLVVAGVVFVVALVGIVVLLNSYNKYSKFVRRYRIYQANVAGADFTEPPSFLREYETQSLNMYVPPDETVQDLGEINMNFAGDPTTPRTGAGAGTVVNPVYGKPSPGEIPNGQREGTTLL
ncbi:protocadherin Fat 4-like [Aplysia californica]|uniref:Protocadherin Fat 4-like n=1 Tax=Aplysia californica TaxID=6500 RepID=A0ABM1VWP6_APLCA|nr:protocadherin Fat 4-like [Aplysia californica]